ncbi:MAG: CPBP family intramembrane metalloprotease [Tepidisphaera sp.]|nr:CPBP family intramembrane metalloprotease [Tepidisphaera sp.]
MNDLTPEQQRTFGVPPTQAPAEAMPGREPRDPGSRGASKFAWVAFVVLLLAVVASNQLGGRPSMKPTPAGQGAAAAPVADQTDPFAINAKFVTKLYYTFKQDMQASPGDLEMLSQSVRQATKTDADQVRAAMVLSNLKDDAAALELLKQAKFDPKQEYAADAALVEKSLEHAIDPASDQGAALTSGERDDLSKRYGWFGDVFLTRDLAWNSPERQRLVGGGGRMLLGITLGGIALLVAVVGGIAAFVTMLARMSSGRIRRRFEPPTPGGSVFIETAAVFVGAYLLFHLAIGAVAAIYTAKYHSPPEWLETAALGGQWILVVVPFWPLLRGMKFGEWRRAIGWHTGRGFWNEVGAGIFGYFASLPILFFALLLTLALVFLQGVIEQTIFHKQPEPPGNPIAELVTSGSGVQLVLIYVLATLWAPLVEESIFRGALFRQMRGRMHFVLAAALSGLCFGVMHGYAGFLLIPVITIGFCFALIREWRGSLIPTATAHFLHNATLLGIVLLVMGSL